MDEKIRIVALGVGSNRGKSLAGIAAAHGKYKNVIALAGETTGKTINFCPWTGWAESPPADPIWRIPPSEMQKIRDALPEVGKSRGMKWSYCDEVDSKYFPGKNA